MIAELPFFIWLIFALALLGVGGWVRDLVSRVLEHRRELALEKTKAGQPPEPVCGCGHHIAFHEPSTGQCHSQVRVVTKWMRNPSFGEDDGKPEEIAMEWESQQCPCRRYSGPEPLTTLYAPELSPDAVREIDSAKPSEPEIQR
ncbi:hypothetical protein [Nonomuraea sp. NPDC049141]|uniref:hypothetical protein n=1 Tax=unclassified Nonomuraea TaxID=2593643 RepID=UPI0033D62EED